MTRGFRSSSRRRSRFASALVHCRVTPAAAATSLPRSPARGGVQDHQTDLNACKCAQTDRLPGRHRARPQHHLRLPLDGERVCHFGDFGQAALRDEQAEAIGKPDILILPVGGGPTIDAEAAAQIARRLGARLLIPMHYRSSRINFLDPVDGFLDQFHDSHVRRLDSPEFDTADLH